MDPRTPRYRRALLLSYLLALVLGASASALGLAAEGFNHAAFPTGSYLSNALWPLWGAFFGMLFMGAGALVPLFLIGASLPFNPQNAPFALQALAFLYGASAGAYLSLYYLEYLESGSPLDETLKHSFKVRAAEALLISFVSVAFGAGM